MLKFNKYILASLFMALFLVACGGGGGGGGSPAPVPSAVNGTVKITVTNSLIPNIVLNFSTAMNPATINSTNVYISADSAPNTHLPISNIIASPGNTVFTFNPISPLQPNTAYTVFVTNGVKTVSGGTAVGSDKFTTPANAVISPTVSMINPIESAVNVSLSPLITLHFSESVSNVTTTTVTLHESSVTGPQVLITTPIKSINNNYTFTPTAHLKATTKYFIVISNQITDLSGVALIPATFNFTTGLFATPTVQMVTPVNNATDVALNQKIELQFSESVLNVNSNNVSLRQGSPSGTLRPISAITESKNNTYYFSPESALDAQTTYYVVVGSGITDISGQVHLESTTFNYTTLNNIVTIGSNNNGNSIIAGQSFTLTATLTQGNSSVVSFANDINTPESVTYSPESCSVTNESPSCSTNVIVGVNTAPESNPGYITLISYTGAAKNPAESIVFSVTQPLLAIALQPESSIVVGESTTVSFTFDNSSIPLGAGDIPVTVSSNNTAVAVVDAPNCTIHYEGGVVTPCTVQVNGVGTGGATITAEADNFIPVSSNLVTVTPVGGGLTPAINITSTLPAGGVVVAGQQFTITATSVNGAMDTVVFTNSSTTPSSVTYSKNLCDVSPSNPSCTTTVTVGLGTADAGNLTYATEISYLVGGFTPLSLEFGSSTPLLAVTQEPSSTPLDIANPGTTTVGFAIQNGSVPVGNGSVGVTISSSNSAVAKVESSSCQINYGSNSSNNCLVTVSPGTESGTATIIASANNFTQATSNIIQVINTNSGNPESPPESGPVESGPNCPESNPNCNPEGNPGESSVVVVSSSLVGPESAIMAGQRFSITATLIQGESSEVRFSNSLFTPSSVTYTPASCNLTKSSNSCSAIAQIGLGTRAESVGYYSANVTYSTGESAALFGQYNVPFAVTQPVLSISQEPTPDALIVGESSTLIFTIPAASVPSGSGSININLSTSDSAAVALSNNQCSISYDTTGVVSPCSISVVGINSGSAKITATSIPQNNFTAVTSKQITVTGSPVKIEVESFTTGGGVYAGQNFGITVTSVAGATESVSFASQSGTPGSVTYSQTSCTVSPGNPCHTTVQVGLNTPVTGASKVRITQSYATDIIYSTGSSIVSFSVETPLLKVAQAATPSQIYVDGNQPDSANAIFTIESTSVPSGNGEIAVALNSSQRTVALVNSSCVIGYSNGQVTSKCEALINSGNNSGLSTINASAQYFESTATNISVLDPTKGFAISQNKSELYTAQSFQIEVNLQKGAPEPSELEFAPSGLGTPGTITVTTNQGGTSCHVTQEIPCIATVFVPLGTAPTALNQNYAISISNIIDKKAYPLEPVKFRVKQPTIQVFNGTAPFILLNNSSSAWFFVPLEQMPDSGFVKINYSQSGNQFDATLINNQQCNIVADDECAISLKAVNAGVSTITASSFGYTSATTNQIMVPQSLTFTLGKSSMAMLGDPGTGVLSLISKLAMTDLPANPGSMALQSFGNNEKMYLYVTDVINNKLLMYPISSQGYPSSLSSQSISTGKNPIKIVLSKAGYVYVLNQVGNSVSVYKIDQSSGFLSLVETQNVSNNPVGIAITPDNDYIFIISQHSNNTGELQTLKINSATGKLKIQDTKNLVTTPTALAVTPDSDNLLVSKKVNAKEIRITNYKFNNGVLKVYNNKTYTQNYNVTGLYINPAVYPEGNPFFYAMTNYDLYPLSTDENFTLLSNFFTIPYNSVNTGITTMAFSNNGLTVYLGSSLGTITMNSLYQNSPAIPQIIESIVSGPIDSIVTTPDYSPNN